MATMAWKVKLFKARSQVDFASSGIAADFVEVFGVQADGPDNAKSAARQWLAVRGHFVRSVNVSAADERTLVVYVAADAAKKAAGVK
jgi:hypothetical protein